MVKLVSITPPTDCLQQTCNCTTIMKRLRPIYVSFKLLFLPLYSIQQPQLTTSIEMVYVCMNTSVAVATSVSVRELVRSFLVNTTWVSTMSCLLRHAACPDEELTRVTNYRTQEGDIIPPSTPAISYRLSVYQSIRVGRSISCR